ncbi:TPA_asm: hypothetical protein GIH59_12660 [Listeria monocytogenes]|nr:hypothetical protein [Listeria monocytogenes]
MNNYQEVLFQAPVSTSEKETPFYQAMSAVGHVQNNEEEAFYVFSLCLPKEVNERTMMLQSLCSFLQIRDYELIQEDMNQEESG